MLPNVVKNQGTIFFHLTDASSGKFIYGKIKIGYLSCVVVDKKTLEDLAVFHQGNSIFHLLDLCTTNDASGVLRQMLQFPPESYEALLARQSAVQYFLDRPEAWTARITNGTLVMIEQYYSSSDTIVQRPNRISLLIDKLLSLVISRNSQSFQRFSVSHIIDLVKGCKELINAHLPEDCPNEVATELRTLGLVNTHPLLQEMAALPKEPSHAILMKLSYRARRELKNTVRKLIASFAKLEALRSLAIATSKLGFCMPVLLPAEEVMLVCENLYHPLVPNATPYSLQLASPQRFLMLTGANMSGKSTLIRALGTAALLAHIGCGVPASSCTISFLNGLVTNMQIADDISKGESYFYAEVQRMKATAKQLAESPYNLVLMDELFKGTNVHDAYECTQAVVQSLLHTNRNILALSTHLYELATAFDGDKRISFKYCATELEADGNFSFSYTLKDGVSRDRIGYLVLKKEGVLDILSQMHD